MKYLIIGAGGTGGALGGYLAKAGKDVAFVARGEQLQALQQQGLWVVRPEEPVHIQPVNACAMEDYGGSPDVIFVCVKGYSLKGITGFLQKTAGADTVVVPILNLYGAGMWLQERLPGVLVTDGCIYVASEIERPGRIRMRGNLLRVVFGVRHPEEYRPELDRIAADLNASGIRGILSQEIRRDALRKFSYVSPQGACGLYYDIPAGEMQKPGVYRECFQTLVEEVRLLSQAMGVPLEAEQTERNLAVLDALDPEMTTSLQRDWHRGGPSEIDGLVYEVPRLGKRLGVELPEYQKIAQALMERRGGAVPSGIMDP